MPAGLVIDNGPQLILIQLLPSSTVAPAVRLKMGVGTFPSFVPGGTLYHPEAPASGGLFELLHYWLTTFGMEPVLARKLVPPLVYPARLVMTDAFAVKVNPVLWFAVVFSLLC